MVCSMDLPYSSISAAQASQHACPSHRSYVTRLQDTRALTLRHAQMHASLKHTPKPRTQPASRTHPQAMDHARPPKKWCGQKEDGTTGLPYWPMSLDAGRKYLVDVIPTRGMSGATMAPHMSYGHILPLQGLLTMAQITSLPRFPGSRCTGRPGPGPVCTEPGVSTKRGRPCVGR